MNIRPIGLRWLRRQHGDIKPAECLFSKLYTAKESWPKVPVWWFEFGEAKLAKCAPRGMHLFCQKDFGVEDFHCLRVPVAFIREHAAGLHFRAENQRYSLYLLPDEKLRFEEIRGGGRIPFGQWRVG